MAKKQKLSPIITKLIGDTPAQPMHQLVMCNLMRETGKVNIRCFFNETWLIPEGYRSFLFIGKWGRVVIAIHKQSCDDNEIVGKILRYVKALLFDNPDYPKDNHNLKYIEEIKNE